MDRNSAYQSVLQELKKKIGEYGSSRLHKSESNHDEPDGDESAEGNEYPGSPDDMTDDENVNVAQNGTPCALCGDSIDKNGNCPSCESNRE